MQEEFTIFISSYRRNYRLQLIVHIDSSCLLFSIVELVAIFLHVSFSEFLIPFVFVLALVDLVVLVDVANVDFFSEFTFIVQEHIMKFLVELNSSLQKNRSLRKWMQIIDLEGLDPSKLQVERLSHYELLAISAEGYVHPLHLVLYKL